MSAIEMLPHKKEIQYFRFPSHFKQLPTLPGQNFPLGWSWCYALSFGIRYLWDIRGYPVIYCLPNIGLLDYGFQEREGC